MDPELIAFLKAEFSAINVRLDGHDARFDGINARLDGHDVRFEGFDRRFDEIQEHNRHTRILVEDLQSDIRLLVEGHNALDEKIDRRFDEAETMRKDDRGHLEAMMKAMFRQLDRRDDELEAQTELALRSASDSGR